VRPAHHHGDAVTAILVGQAVGVKCKAGGKAQRGQLHAIGHVSIHIHRADLLVMQRHLAPVRRERRESAGRCGGSGSSSN
jgi:hypothetical protein